MRAVASFLLIFIFISGCGYRPSANHSKEVVGEKVSTQILISMQDPENTVLIKDAVNKAVVTRFRSSLVGEKESETHLKIMITDIIFSPLQYNLEGYVVTYRTHLTLQILRTHNDEAQTYITKGIYDFAIEPNAIISDQARFVAIKVSAQKAIDSFIAAVASQGAMKTKD
jgi:hypothetical protein